MDRFITDPYGIPRFYYQRITPEQHSPYFEGRGGSVSTSCNSLPVPTQEVVREGGQVSRVFVDCIGNRLLFPTEASSVVGSQQTVGRYL